MVEGLIATKVLVSGTVTRTSGTTGGGNTMTEDNITDTTTTNHTNNMATGGRVNPSRTGRWRGCGGREGRRRGPSLPPAVGEGEGGVGGEGERERELREQILLLLAAGATLPTGMGTREGK